MPAKKCNNISKYKELEIEIEKMQHLRITTVPDIVGVLGMIKKGTYKHIDKIPGNHSQYKLTKNCS